MALPITLPSQLSDVIEGISVNPSLNKGVVAFRSRSEITTPLMRRILGIAMVPAARKVLDDAIDIQAGPIEVRAGEFAQPTNDVVIGAGYHAAVYCAVRYCTTGIKPLVLEASERPGGVFACSRGPSFWMNSRNRPGIPTQPGEGGALNVIPGALIQPSMLTATEFLRNSDMAFAIRLALVMFARVVTKARVSKIVSPNGSGGVTVQTYEGYSVVADRVIDARGLGRPKTVSGACDHVLSFQQFMARLDQPFPFRGLRRVAVVGDGDSARTAVEALLGQGPGEHWSIAEWDRPERIDWFAPGIPRTCTDYAATSRTRYKAIAGALPRDATGRLPSSLNVRNEMGATSSGYEVGYVNDTAYDLVITARGWYRDAIPGIGLETEYVQRGGRDVATQRRRNCFVVGPAADLPFAAGEARGVKENYTAIWRLGPRTAAFAASLAE